MMFLANIYIIFFMYQYKSFGLAHGISDFTLSLAGSVSGITQAITRLSTGYFYDKVGFKTLFYIIIIINLICSTACYFAVSVPWAYFICIQLNFMTLGAVFSLFPAPVVKTFGPTLGPKMYSFVMLSSPLVTVLVTIMVSTL